MSTPGVRRRRGGKIVGKDVPASEPRIQSPRDEAARSVEIQADVPRLTAAPDEITIVEGKQLTIRCGESSITLTAAGKIILRGKYIVSRSSGVQRIKGGSVQIN